MLTKVLVFMLLTLGLLIVEASDVSASDIRSIAQNKQTEYESLYQKMAKQRGIRLDVVDMSRGSCESDASQQVFNGIDAATRKKLLVYYSTQKSSTIFSAAFVRYSLVGSINDGDERNILSILMNFGTQDTDLGLLLAESDMKEPLAR